MQNIIKNPTTYKRFVNCSVAIEILVCLILLVLLVKQAYNFYMKNYMLYMLAEQGHRKYQQPTDVMLENQSVNKKKQQTSSPKEIVSTMKTSKAQLTAKPPAIKSQKTEAIPTENPKKQPIKIQFSLRQKTRTDLDDPQKKTNRYRINLNIERIVLKLPIFAIMVINIALLTSYQFLTIMAYICIVVLVVNQFVAERWITLGYILDLAIGGVTIAAFINGFVTVRMKVN